MKRIRHKPCNRLKYLKQTRVYRAGIKLLVLTHYGPNHTLTCSWPNCDVTDVDMLSIDHIENDGAKHRRALSGKNRGGGQGGGKLYVFLKKTGFPTGYQTLCFNHQFKKELIRLRARACQEEELLSHPKVEHAEKIPPVADCLPKEATPQMALLARGV